VQIATDQTGHPGTAEGKACRTRSRAVSARTIAAACTRSWLSDRPRDSDLVFFGTFYADVAAAMAQL
jgi:hypothetical protein